MKRMIAGLMLAAVATVAGCGKDGTPGGPGVTDPNNKPLVGQADDTFTLTTSSVSVKPGATTASSVGIKRGARFDQDVTLEFADLPKGVTVDPAKPVLASKASEAKFTVAAGDDVTPGSYTLRLTGQPASGPPARNEVSLTVGKKDTFTLNPPGNILWAPSLQQGESKNYSISVSRDSTFREDVTLKFDGLPKGLTIEPAAPVVKNGQSEITLVMKAADDATVGKHVVKVTGHPTKGADVTQDMTVTVSKK